MNKVSLKKIGLGFLGIIAYFIFSLVIPYLLNYFIKDFSSIPQLIKMIISILTNLLLILTLFAIFKDPITKNYLKLKENHQDYFKNYFKYWILIIGTMMISNLFILIFSNNEISNNEKIIRDLFSQNPIYVFITAVILGPIIEELVFRQSIRNIISNNTLFIIISGIIFGSLHVITNITSPSELLYIIPYSLPGMILAYSFVKSKNIFVPIGLHFINNGLLLSLQFIALIMGGL